MGATRESGSRSDQDLGASRRTGSAAEVVDFAVTELLRDDTALGALPEVLARLTDLPGVRAALAFQPTMGQPPTVLARYPGGAFDAALLARIGALTLAQRDTAAGDILLAYSVPVDGRCLCALALTGDAASWTQEARSTAHAVAAMVATQIRHANNLARLAERQAHLERSHAALADQTERLNCLIDAAIPGILIADEQGLITNISRSFGAMFGIERPEELVGAPGGSVVRRIRPLFADPDAFTRRITETFGAREPITGEQMKTTDGRTFECDYWPVLADGRYRGDLWLAWDMSYRADLEEQRQAALEAEHAARHLAEQAQRQLTEQNERLQAQDEARNQFLSVVSHELRTPLTSIVSFSELLRGEEEGLSPDGLKFLDIIERNANRLHRLIGDLFMLNRLEVGALPLDLADVDVPWLAAEAVRSAAGDAARQEVTIDVTAEAGGTVPPVRGDANRLLQVLDNLLSNAIKFSHRGGQVHVTASCQDRTWRIDVADSGIGIPPGEASYLFSRFVRGSNARSAEVPGTGLGLSIVKVIVEMHGGRVEVASTLDVGSTFSVYLPAAA